MVCCLLHDGIRGFSFIRDVWGLKKLKFQIFFKCIFSYKKLDERGCVGGYVAWEAESEMDICVQDFFFFSESILESDQRSQR